jgi:broad specificity phosphatase PhoE
VEYEGSDEYAQRLRIIRRETRFQARLVGAFNDVVAKAGNVVAVVCLQVAVSWLYRELAKVARPVDFRRYAAAIGSNETVVRWRRKRQRTGVRSTEPEPCPPVCE